MKTVEEIRAAKTGELVAWYNTKAEKPVKKFTDRETAERRCISLLVALNALEEQHKDNAAAAWEDLNVRPVVHAPRQVAEPVIEESLDELTDEEFEAKVKEELNATPERKSNAAGIAASWNDAKVAEARLTRNGVIVEWNGKSEEFKSVRAAFLALNLPDSKHIRFRMKVKEAGSAVFPWTGVDYLFKLV